MKLFICARDNMFFFLCSSSVYCLVYHVWASKALSSLGSRCIFIDIKSIVEMISITELASERLAL